MSALENFTEDQLEQAAVEIFKKLGYDYVFAPDKQGFAGGSP